MKALVSILSIFLLFIFAAVTLGLPFDNPPTTPLPRNPLIPIFDPSTLPPALVNTQCTRSLHNAHIRAFLNYHSDRICTYEPFHFVEGKKVEDLPPYPEPVCETSGGSPSTLDIISIAQRLFSQDNITACAIASRAERDSNGCKVIERVGNSRASICAPEGLGAVCVWAAVAAFEVAAKCAQGNGKAGGKVFVGKWLGRSGEVWLYLHRA